MKFRTNKRYVLPSIAAFDLSQFEIKHQYDVFSSCLSTSAIKKACLLDVKGFVACQPG